MLRSPRLKRWLADEKPRIIDTLVHWTAIPSVSAVAGFDDQVRAAADYCAGLLSEARFRRVRLVETPGSPVVAARWSGADSNAPTVLLYGHYDVQPAAPLSEWLTPPFIVHRDGSALVGRGLSEAKGPVLSQIEAARGLLALDGVLPVNLLVVIEGEATIGSPHLGPVLDEILAEHTPDAMITPDATNLMANRPSACAGHRGIASFDVEIRVARRDMHAGHLGGTVVNPTHVLARLVDDLHDHHQRVTIPGFYHRVREVTEEFREAMALAQLDEELLRATEGVRTFRGEPGYTPLERTITRPSCDVVRFTAGNQSEAIKDAVPAAAEATISFHLVPDQSPGEVAASFRSWLEARVPPGVEATVRTRVARAPASTPIGHPAFTCLLRGLKRGWETDPVFTRNGTAGPPPALRSAIGDAPMLFLPVGLVSDGIHAPNERLDLDVFWKAIYSSAEIWQELAKRMTVRQ